MERRAAVTLNDLLTTKQVHYIMNQTVGNRWQLLDSHITPACLGLSGFLGDHFRITFDVKLADTIRKVNIFVKCLPMSNEPKAKIINENNFYRREMLMFELFGTMQANANEPNPWCTKAYICTDSIVVMPDLLYEGYRQCTPLDYLDTKHTLLTAASVARYHAAFANYETKRSHGGCLPFNQEYADLLKEATFNDSLWLHAAAKLTKNFLSAFSEKFSEYPANLEEILIQLYIEACDSFTESDSLNVVNHKDLWVNNIMFKYEGNVPVNALLIDFQCIRYGPPAFDVMIFLYLNTSRNFRQKYENMIFKHYYAIFLENIDDKTKARLKMLGYDFDSFVGWCHRARVYGLLVAIGIFPYVLMKPDVAEKTFDDPKTFMKYLDEDRTEPVTAHARECAAYRQRQLEVCEEFVERYVLKKVGQ